MIPEATADSLFARVRGQTDFLEGGERVLECQFSAVGFSGLKPERRCRGVLNLDMPQDGSEEGRPVKGPNEQSVVMFLQPQFARGDIMEAREEQKQNRFQIEKLEERIASTILQVNGGGNIPNGNANGVDFSNPAGHEPPGCNK